MRTCLVAAMLLFAAVGCSKSSTSQPASSGAPAAPAAEKNVAIPNMTVDEVAQALAAKQITALDCNPELTRKRMGVVPGAILLSSHDSYAASELPADKTAKLVFYCMNPG